MTGDINKRSQLVILFVSNLTKGHPFFVSEVKIVENKLAMWFYLPSGEATPFMGPTTVVIR